MINFLATLMPNHRNEREVLRGITSIIGAIFAMVAGIGATVRLGDIIGATNAVLVMAGAATAVCVLIVAATKRADRADEAARRLLHDRD